MTDADDGAREQVISPLNVYFNSKLIFQEYELWRLVTNFFFFGSLGVDFVFHMFFLSRYCRMLEEGSFQGRSCDFFYMLLFGGTLLTAFAPFVNVQFLGTSLTFMMVYVWGRIRPHTYTIMNVRLVPKNCTLTKGANAVSSVPPNNNM